MKPGALPIIALLALLALLPACQTPQVQRAPEISADLVAEGRKLIAAAPAKDKNLWAYQVALLAMKQGRYAEAQELFGKHLPPAGALLRGGASGQQSRSLFQPEGVKVFYGEPHERTMAWLYRGVLHWMDGEADNARACFRTAQLFDLSEDSAHQSDWILLGYLDGLITSKLGGDGADALKRARANAGSRALPEYDRAANVMVVLQYGFGPVKKSGGNHGERLAWAGGHSTVQAAVVRNGTKAVRAPVLDDVSFQASTRGLRRMDTVLAQKAGVKKVADVVGDVGVVPGLILSQPAGTRDAGLVLLGAGLTGKAVGGSVEPRADTRTWNNLPQHLAFAALRLPAGRQRLTVDFYDADGQLLSDLSRTLELDVKPQGDTVVFVADK